MPDCLALEDTCLNTFSLYLFFNTGETDNKKVNEKIADDDKYQMMNIIRVMSWRTPGDFFFGCMVRVFREGFSKKVL